MPTTSKQSSNSPCPHNHILTTPSSHAVEVGYHPWTPQQLFTAATGSRKAVSQSYFQYQSHFPGPLVLPGDELANDPRHSPQSFRTWLSEKERNKVTKQRGTVYVAAPPKVRDGERVMEGWDVPWTEEPKSSGKGRKKQQNGPASVAGPSVEDVVAYLEAFFHGVPVKVFPGKLEFTGTNATIVKGRADSHIELRSVASGFETTMDIRTRELSPKAYVSPYRHQLNLNDLLDLAIAVLPEDAYCLLLMVDHDLYEDENDDFCCGRAYGGSRIAVVSSAQYNPAVDAFHGVDVLADTGHVWPGSHCQEFADSICGGESKSVRNGDRQPRNKPKRAGDGDDAEEERDIMHVDVQDSTVVCGSTGNAVDIGSLMSAKKAIRGNSVAEPSERTPLEAALSAHRQRLRGSKNKPALREANLHSTYLQRVALTASHELLHCFGLDHCVFYACVMQITASLAEDNRQPPYLCPVCENKLAWAVSNDLIGKVQTKSEPDWWESQRLRDWRMSRNQAILRFCREGNDGDPEFFASLAAWVEAWLEVENELEH